MVYIDTSVIVAVLTNEASASRISLWLKRRSIDRLYVSAWTVTEFSSALAMKVRTRQLTLEQRQIASTAFNRLLSRSFDMVPIGPSHYLAAARFCDRVELGLRAGDSLHMAIAMHAGLSVATLDAKLANACETFGVPSEFLQ